MPKPKSKDEGERLTDKQEKDLKEMEEDFEKVKQIVEKWTRHRDINRIIGDKK